MRELRLDKVEDQFSEEMTSAKAALEGYLIVDLVTDPRELGTWKWELATAAMRLEHKGKVLLEKVPRGARMTLLSPEEQKRLEQNKVEALRRALEFGVVK
jgi:hypothetical protein